MQFFSFLAISAAAVAAAVAAATRVIRILPGGYQAMYLLGIVNYIRDHYDLSDVVFTGASAGAYNLLAMTIQNVTRDEHALFTRNMIDIFQRSKSLMDILPNINSYFLDTFQLTHFDTDRIFIETTTAAGRKRIFSNFSQVSELLDACAASSHIPFITHNAFGYSFRDEVLFDGAFTMLLGYEPTILREISLPASSSLPVVLTISFHMWTNTLPEWLSPGFLLTNPFWAAAEVEKTLMRRGKDFNKMYMDGYRDAHENRAKLDEALLRPPSPSPPPIISI